jgi:hypothetical protein
LSRSLALKIPGLEPIQLQEGVQWHLPAIVGRAATGFVAEAGGIEMGKGQVQKSKTNKPKLSPKEKKAAKAAKKAAKASK